MSVIEVEGKHIEAKRAPRTRGRRPSLTRAQIVEAAVALLTAATPETFTLARLAKALGVSVMALYTYFPSRDALLDAVAEHVFSIFVPPSPQPRWQGEVHAWLWALQRHFEHYPIALKLLGWEAHVSAAWVRAWLPVARLIQAQGLEGEPLAFAVSWFTHTAIGTMNAYHHASFFRSAEAFATAADGLDPEDYRFAAAHWRALPAVDPAASLDFGFAQIVRGLESLITEKTEGNCDGGA